MKKLLLILSLGLAVFADKLEVKPSEPMLLEETVYYTVVCIRGYEYIFDNQGVFTQAFGKAEYTVTGVGSIPVQVPIECSREIR